MPEAGTRLSRIFDPIQPARLAVNSHRILSLLAGTKLYHTPFAAIRELIQNAFDAVREQISIELLQDTNPLDEVVRQARSHLHRVSLGIEVRDDELWIVCHDTGTGMTRRIIEKHLLVSGSSPRPELLELRRDCLNKGVRFERSGEFGMAPLPGVSPERIILCDGPLPHIRAVYVDLNEGRKRALRQFGPGIQVDFPPEWHDVAAIQTEDALFANAGHQLFGNVSHEVWSEFRERVVKSKSIKEIVENTAIINGDLAAAWFIYNFDESEKIVAVASRGKPSRLAKNI